MYPGKWMFLLVAVIIDVFVEYPNAAHPTVWVGNIVVLFDRIYKRKNSALDTLAGGFAALAAYLAAFVLGILVCRATGIGIVGALLYIYFLKSGFSAGLLIKKVKGCAVDDERELRRRVSEIVSRDVNVPRPFLYSAAIESGAENIVDSVVSPIFYYMIFGIPGILIYRAINTADGIIGHKTDRYIRFGKVAATVDYVANYVPARLFAAILYVLYGRGYRKHIRMKKGLRMNGKYPIALFARLLNVRLVKKGSYVIGDGSLPSREDVEKGAKLLLLVIYSFIFSALIISYVLDLPRWC
ncbi:MAG: adenosylcobinamide-phosphate synthase CbiB [Nitrososphaeria archaeon]